MNISWIILCCYIVATSFIKWIFNDESFEGFSVFDNKQIQRVTSYLPMRPTGKHVYNRDTLVAIQKQTTGVRISSEVCTRIRELRINNVMKWKQQRKRAGRKKYPSQLSCNIKIFSEEKDSTKFLHKKYKCVYSKFSVAQK